MRTTARQPIKEVAGFLLAAAACGTAFYVCLTASPVPLSPSDPVVAYASPSPLSVASAPAVLPENQYLEGGRLSPFAPVRKMVVRGPKVPPPWRPEYPEEKEQPTAGREQGNGGKDVHSGDARTPPVALGYVGVIQIGNRSYGLLQRKDGAGRYVVEPEKTAPADDFSVLKIEKQAIHVLTRDGQKLVLSDDRFPAAPKPEALAPEVTEPKTGRSR
jgi:hypothetical protein